MSISDRAVLVQLNISSWGTERLDKSQTERINLLNNADAKAGKVHKDLMCGTTLAKDIDLHVGRSRLWIATRTQCLGKIEVRGCCLLACSFHTRTG
jgi:hypothetical protein